MLFKESGFSTVEGIARIFADRRRADGPTRRSWHSRNMRQIRHELDSETGANDLPRASITRSLSMIFRSMLSCHPAFNVAKHQTASPFQTSSRNADRDRLGNGRMTDEDRFDFGRVEDVFRPL